MSDADSPHDSCFVGLGVRLHKAEPHALQRSLCLHSPDILELLM